MTIIRLLFYVAALVLLVLAAANVTGRINTLAAGLACWLVAGVFVPMLG